MFLLGKCLFTAISFKYSSITAITSFSVYFTIRPSSDSTKLVSFSGKLINLSFLNIKRAACNRFHERKECHFFLWGIKFVVQNPTI